METTVYSIWYDTKTKARNILPWDETPLPVDCVSVAYTPPMTSEQAEKWADWYETAALPKDEDESAGDVERRRSFGITRTPTTLYLRWDDNEVVLRTGDVVMIERGENYVYAYLRTGDQVDLELPSAEDATAVVDYFRDAVDPSQ